MDAQALTIFEGFQTHSEIIPLAVLLYVSCPLSLRKVEDLRFDRSVEIGHQSRTLWWHSSDPVVSAEIRMR